MDILPDRQAQERLDDWRVAERRAARELPGTLGALRAGSALRCARWAFEDASNLASADHGDDEPLGRRAARLRRRSEEVTAEATARITARGYRPPRDRPVRVATAEELELRVREQAEIDRETGNPR